MDRDGRLSLRSTTLGSKTLGSKAVLRVRETRVKGYWNTLRENAVTSMTISQTKGTLYSIYVTGLGDSVGVFGGAYFGTAGNDRMLLIIWDGLSPRGNILQ